jgi:methionyl-tRNA synthetase
MQTIEFDPGRFHPAYDVRLLGVLPRPTCVGPPFFANWVIVAPGESTKPHRHDEFETFFVFEGAGRVVCDGVTQRVGKGTVIHFNPFEHHTLENDGEGDLIFLTVAWRDSRRAAMHAAKAAVAAPGADRRRYVISAPPTPNGDLHLGHISGPYLGADIHARYLRMRGLDALHVTGCDDFQSYVAAKADAIGISPAETADRYAAEIGATFDATSIVVDHMARPLHSPEYRAEVARLFGDLVRSGAIYADEQPALIDPASGRYLFEFAVAGLCPYCRSPTGGNLCEECGHPNSCVDLLSPASSLAGAASPPEVRMVRRLHFRLSRYADALRRLHDRQSVPPRLRTLLEQLIARGLPDVAVTHPGTWGVSVPVAGFEEQTIWAWVEMALGYIATVRRLEAADPRDPADFLTTGQAVQFFGYDNTFYYAVLFPALYTALFPDREINIRFVYNEFYLLEGRKFSTSRGHAIWARDFAREHPVDAVRFFLSYSRPEAARTNFSRGDFLAVAVRELEQGWQGWLLDLGARLQRDWNGRAPDTGSWTLQQKAFYARLQQLTGLLAESYDAVAFSPRAAARLLCELVRETVQFSAGERHWNGLAAHESERRTAIVLEITAARLLALLSAPLMPGFAARLWHRAGGGTPLQRASWPDAPPIPPAGTEVDLTVPFFSFGADDIAAATAA